MKWLYNPPALRPAREAAGLTRRSVAFHLRRTEEFVYRCEAGKSQPSSNDLAGMASLYGVSPASFFVEAPIPSRKPVKEIKP